MRTNDALPRKMQNVENATERWRNIRSGTVASSPIRHCTAAQATNKIPNTVNKTAMRPLLHEYWLPPHWSAINRQVMLATKRTVPMGSNWRKVARMLCCDRNRGSFEERKRMMRGIAATPTGRLTGSLLIQKCFEEGEFPYYKSTSAMRHELE